MRHNFTRNFIICGLSGWCMECFWTGLSSAITAKDKNLKCNTSIWMFPIYGLAACMAPICKLVKKKHTFIRGSVYTLCIFAAEFGTGNILKKHGICPWDYSKAKANIKGLIRLDYAPLWFLVGLFYEKLIDNQS